MQKVKSIEQIFDKIKDFDLVLTTDPSLRDGLNALKEGICFTPKEFVKDKKLIDNISAAIEISSKLNISLKIAQHLIERINNLWENVGTLEKVAGFLSEDEKKVLDVLKELPTLNNAIGKLNFKELTNNKKTAVIAENWFSALDKKSLPEKYTNITLFENKQPKISEFLVFNSHKDIIDRLTELVTEKNQDDVAIVVPKESPLSSLIKSRLKSKGVKLNQTTFLKDHFGVRLFLGLIDISFNLYDIKVREILPYLEMFELEIKPKFNNYMFSYYVNRINKDTQLEGFFSFIKSIKTKTYAELALLLNGKVELPKEFNKLLKNLALSQEKMIEESYYELSYSVENFDLVIKEQKEGVLIIDAVNSAFVNRPLCFFLGLDNSWLRNIQSREGINVKEAEEIDREKFQVLMQQGKHQFYLVSEFTDNQNTVPCYYLNILFNTKINSFLDGLFNPRRIRNKKVQREYCPEELKVEYEKDHLDLFSQSSFNNFVTCPKKYSYSKLLPQEEQTYFLKGTLLHEFAEFYFEYKDFVEEEGLDSFIKIMVNKYKRINGDLNIDFEQSLFTIAIKNIIKFINSLEIEDLKDSPFSLSPYKKKNTFAERFNKELKSENTEANFSDKEFGIRGIIDLIVNSSTIVDYKTSAFVKYAKDIIKGSNFNLISDIVDFQPCFYIMELRKHTPGEIKFIYNFLLANKDLVVDGKPDKRKKNIVEVKYIPLTFNDFLCTKSAIVLLASSKDRSSLIATLKDYNVLIDFFKKTPIEKELQYDYEKLLDSDYAKKFHSFLKDKLKDRYNYFSEIINSFLKSIVWLRTGIRQKQALIFKEDIDEFEEFLHKKNKEINLFLNDKFPYNPINTDICKTCDFRQVCLRRYVTRVNSADFSMRWKR